MGTSIAALRPPRGSRTRAQPRIVAPSHILAPRLGREAEVFANQREQIRRSLAREDASNEARVRSIPLGLPAEDPRARLGTEDETLSPVVEHFRAVFLGGPRAEDQLAEI